MRWPSGLRWIAPVAKGRLVVYAGTDLGERALELFERKRCVVERRDDWFAEEPADVCEFRRALTYTAAQPATIYRMPMSSLKVTCR